MSGVNLNKLAEVLDDANLAVLGDFTPARQSGGMPAAAPQTSRRARAHDTSAIGGCIGAVVFVIFCAWLGYLLGAV